MREIIPKGIVRMAKAKLALELSRLTMPEQTKQNHCRRTDVPQVETVRAREVDRSTGVRGQSNVQKKKRG